MIANKWGLARKDAEADRDAWRAQAEATKAKNGALVRQCRARDAQVKGAEAAAAKEERGEKQRETLAFLEKMEGDLKTAQATEATAKAGFEELSAAQRWGAPSSTTGCWGEENLGTNATDEAHCGAAGNEETDVSTEREMGMP